MNLAKSLRKFAVIAAAASAYVVATGQDTPPDAGMPPPPSASTPQAAPLTPAELDQLVAPVALYDDSLLTSVLTASTYPLEVVEAHRWLADPGNASLKGDELANALAQRDWDPSVKALVPFPSVLAMLDSHLDWTERLGEAFLAQQGDVMDAVQRMRHRAETTGTLKSSPQQTVADDGGDVTISPPPSDVIYVSTYDPWCAYGVWPYPIYGPYYYSPWLGYCAPGDYAILFDAGLYLPFAWWDWGYFDWRNHRVGIRRDRYDRFHPDHVPAGNVWTHDPSHRGNVPYRDPRNSQQFQPTRDYQSFRGYEGRDGAPTGLDRSSPPAFESFGPGRDVQIQSQRGATSRGGGFGGAPHGFGGGMRGGGGGGHGRP